MNWDQVEGRWTEFKGRVREAYGELSDDEVEKARGDREQLAGIVQAKYGKSKEDARNELDRMIAEL
ncbi:Uncharacterized conserved protein YjbJ, UPF0337 family [Poseidonocella pacifica]|uniref:Uncharacterized conserved protein YjbJ, UPF0337 family n=1 Tax=Poseidonocella pacifica TaxID=871651 RepID=A0A1I0YDF1_9RHOB|nr:CsbD family protein [Poseidonocella pacifica]SFB11374.1 Uncharacterized conserved protein YjbJ, UPF0337 family [Poseidonocella pacifica]